MATSTITLILCDITPERNCMVDNLSTYLLEKSTYYQEIENFQYLKITQEKIIKIAAQLTTKLSFNYVKIKNSDDPFMSYYYFVINTAWKSSDTIELQLSLDTLNTFASEIKALMTSKTNITRQHKDRFVKVTLPSTGNVNLRRIVDEYSEGISPIKYEGSGTKITIANSDYNWYLIYKKKAVESGTPLECFCVPDVNLYTYFAPESAGVKYDQLTQGTYTVFYARDNGDFQYTTSAGKSYDIGPSKKYKAVGLFRQTNQNSLTAYLIMDNQLGGNSIVTDDTKNGNLQVDANYTGVVLQNQNLVGYQFASSASGSQNILTLGYNSLITLYNTQDKTKFTVAESARDIYISSIYDIDRTDNKLVKIIKMPYAPFEISYTTVNGKQSFNIPDSWSLDTEFNMLKLNSLDQDFLTSLPNLTIEGAVLTVNVATDLVATKSASKLYESKLYHSDYYTRKYYYDNFSKEFYNERYNFNSTATPYILIKFKQSNNISSNSLFDFSVTHAQYNEPTIYSRYMNVNRQNEVALYTDDYINYIRNGYNYDKKATTQQSTVSAFGIALSTAGSVASFLAGGVGVAAGISLATSTLSQLVSAINNNITSEENIKQKLKIAENSPSSVSNTEDLNLLSYYNGNRLISTDSKVSDQVKNSIYQLFRLTGYACNDYGIPKFNSRTWYNFIQCDPAFNESSWLYSQEFLNDIKTRFKIGVTVYHSVGGTYDFLQEKENFETWLISRV